MSIIMLMGFGSVSNHSTTHMYVPNAVPLYLSENRRTGIGGKM